MEGEFYLVPSGYPFLSQSRVMRCLERLPFGRVLCLTLRRRDKVSEYIFVCSLVSYIRDKYPNKSIDSSVFSYLDANRMHRSVFRISDAVRLLASSERSRSSQNIVQLNHVVVSGLPLQWTAVVMQLIPSVYGNSVVRYFDSSGTVNLTLQFSASESFALLLSVGGVRLAAVELLGLSLFVNPFQTLTKTDLNPDLEISFPLPHNFSVTLVAETLGQRACGKREVVLMSLPIFEFSGRETEECQICMENFRTSEELMAFPCLHHFHRHCVEEWTKHKLLCPNCRCDAYDLLAR
jgi:hypothetical protein